MGKSQLEFFDCRYSAKEAYGRLWAYVRRYRLRILIGIISGLLTAGTLLPVFALVQPSFSRIEEGVASCTRAENFRGEYHGFVSFCERFNLQCDDRDEVLGLPLLLMILVILPGAVVLRCGLLFLSAYCLAWAGMRSVRDLRVEIMKSLSRQSVQFYGRIDVGRLMTRSTSDPRHVQFIVQTVLQELARAPFEIAVSLGFAIWTAMQNDLLLMMGVFLVGFPLFVFPVLSFSKHIRKWAHESLARFSIVGKRIHEVLTCVQVVKSFNCEAYEEDRYAKVNDEMLDATLKSLRWGLLVGPAVETVGIFLLCVVLVWCFAAQVKISEIISVLAPLLVVYKPIKQLSKLQLKIEQGRAALSRIWSIVDLHQELPERPNVRRKSDFTDKIVFDDVTFRYETADRDAVSHASFEIPRGKMVAVVGGTGSGKTTMSGLLSRFFDPDTGRVTLDGTDLRDFRISDLRMLIGAVQQETLLFNDTIEENIKYGSPEATHEEVVAAAKLANAHDFILSQPEGYARICGEKGFALSGGERQRIAIARAILRNPPILILDEATSALDTVTERLVQDALTKLMANRTVFAIAHRLSTIRNADLILVMDRGVIVERGTHDELYAANGVYRKLCDMQKTS